jgi:predicted GNAT superfamily acetyltransferase
VAEAPITISTELEAAVLALNNAHAVELSYLGHEQLRALLTQAFYARRIGNLDAFLIAFDELARYESLNYLWFRARYPRFVYVDRVVVAPRARGRGLARALYADLFDHAGRAGHDVIVCEVNVAPPNPASDTLHAGSAPTPHR